MTLKCDAIGNPLPVLSWIYDDRVLISSSKSDFSNDSQRMLDADLIEKPFVGDQDDINGMIRFKYPYAIEIELHLNGWPAGVYRFDCSAYNRHGKDERSTFIEHALKPTFPHKNVTLIDATNGLPITLYCDDLNGFPAPKITWQKVCKSKT